MRYWLKNVWYPTSPSELNEKSLVVSLAVSTQHTNLTEGGDGRTDTARQQRPRYGKNCYRR